MESRRRQEAVDHQEESSLHGFFSNSSTIQSLRLETTSLQYKPEGALLYKLVTGA